jgi:hypothetical protein
LDIKIENITAIVLTDKFNLWPCFQVIFIFLSYSKIWKYGKLDHSCKLKTDSGKSIPASQLLIISGPKYCQQAVGKNSFFFVIKLVYGFRLKFHSECMSV